MKKLLILLVLFNCKIGLTQNNIRKENHLKIIASVSIDFNNDNNLDGAKVIEHYDDSLKPTSRDLIVEILTKNGEPKIVFKKKDFIPLDNPDLIEGPFDNLSVSKDGLLEITYRFWHSMGSWTATNKSYFFSFEDEKFHLIRFKEFELHRGSGDFKESLIDFKNQTLTIQTSNISSEDEPLEEVSNFELNKLKTLESFNKSFEWKFLGYTI